MAKLDSPIIVVSGMFYEWSGDPRHADYPTPIPSKPFHPRIDTYRRVPVGLFKDGRIINTLRNIYNANPA